MPTRQVPIRFSEEHWAEIQKDAARHGISGAQFVREAVAMRQGDERARRRDPTWERAVHLARLPRGPRA